MSHAEICPICKGAGKLPDLTSASTGGISIPKMQECHGCLGKGWVEVHDSMYPGHWPWPYRTYTTGGACDKPL